ncbi:hypothetical protein [Rubellimicrobium roseum]|nr:hypothetical protein [Rubellimicrobium roseum]
MLVKAVILFLCAMAVIAWVGGLLGRLRLPGPKREAFCPSCGRPRIGKGSCPCGRA